MENTAIVLTGLLNSRFVNLIRQFYNNIPNVIVSTWNDQDSYLIDDLSANGFTVLLHDYPEHANSTNVQIYAAQKGVLYAQSLGFKYAYHSRTDVFPLNYAKFIGSIKDLYESKLTVVSGLSHAYILDILVVGPIEKLLKLYNNLQEPDDNRYVEIFLMENYYNKTNLSRDDIRSEINFCLDRCRENNIEIIWFRNTEWEGGTRTIPMMRVISEYCTEPGIYT